MSLLLLHWQLLHTKVQIIIINQYYNYNDFKRSKHILRIDITVLVEQIIQYCVYRSA